MSGCTTGTYDIKHNHLWWELGSNTIWLPNWDWDLKCRSGKVKHGIDFFCIFNTHCSMRKQYTNHVTFHISLWGNKSFSTFFCNVKFEIFSPFHSPFCCFALKIIYNVILLILVIINFSDNIQGTWMHPIEETFWQQK